MTFVNIVHECFRLQKQPSRGILKKRCPENMHQIYRRTPMPKCVFDKVAFQLYWNNTSAWVFSVNLLHIFRTAFPKNTAASEVIFKENLLKCLRECCENPNTKCNCFLSESHCENNKPGNSSRFFLKCIF